MSIDAKKVTITSNVDFCDLPTEATETDVVKNESNKLKTDLRVTFTRLYTKAIYGSKKDKLERNAEHVSNVGKFLESFFASNNANNNDDEDSDVSETYTQWLERCTVRIVQLTLMTRAKLQAAQNERMSVETFSNQAAQMLDSGKLDLSEIEKIEKMLAAAKAKAMAA